MSQAIARERVEELLAQTEDRLREYEAAGGEDSAYLEGKVEAYRELLAESSSKKRTAGAQ